MFAVLMVKICFAMAVVHCPAVEIADIPGYAEISPFHGVIRVSPKLIALMRTDDERVFALAHEVSHIVLRHSGMIGLDLEIAADSRAIILMKSLAYDCRAAPRLLQKLKQPQTRIEMARRNCHATS